MIRDFYREIHLLIEQVRVKANGDLLNALLVPAAELILIKYSESKFQVPEKRVFNKDHSFIDAQRLWIKNNDLRRFSAQLHPEISSISQNKLDYFEKLKSNSITFSSIENFHNFDTFILNHLFDWIKNFNVQVLEDREYLSESFDYLLKVVRGYSKISSEYFTSDALIELATMIAGPFHGKSIYDPCFGSAGFLLSANKKIASEKIDPRILNDILASSSQLYGTEINPNIYIVGLVRLLLSGIEYPPIYLGSAFDNTLAPNLNQYDIIFANPPFNQSNDLSGNSEIKYTRSDDLFIDHIISRLKNSGKAYVVVPEGLLFRAGKTRELRKKLIERNFIEGIISFPRGVMFNYSNLLVNLLVLRKESANNDIWFQKIPPSSEYSISDKNKALFNIEKQAQIFNNRIFSENSISVSNSEIIKRNYELSFFKFSENKFERLVNKLVRQDESIKIYKLGEIAKLFRGIDEKRYLHKAQTNYSNKELKLLKVSNIKFNDISLPTEPSPYLFSSDDLSYKKLKSKDILLTASATIGRSTILKENPDNLFASSSIQIIRVIDPFLILPEYLLRILQTEPYLEWFSTYSIGSVLSDLRYKDLREIRIPVPALEVQQRIVSSLTFGESESELMKNLSKGTYQKTEFEIALNKIRNEIVHSTTSNYSELLTKIKNITKSLSSVPKSNTEQEVWFEFENLFHSFINSEKLKSAESRFDYFTDLHRSLNNRYFESNFSKENEKELIKYLISNINNLVETENKSILSKTRLKCEIIPTPAIFSLDAFQEITIKIINVSIRPLINLEIEIVPGGKIYKLNSLERNEEHIFSHTFYEKKPGNYEFNIHISADMSNQDKYKEDFPFIFEVIMPDKITTEIILSSKDDLSCPPLASVWERKDNITNLKESKLLLDVNYSVSKITNPYLAGPPVKDPDMFFGRKNIIKTIIAQLKSSGKSDIIILEGTRRTGKSSILNYLCVPGILSDNWIPVYCDFQGAEGSKDGTGIETQEIFIFIAQKISDSFHNFHLATLIPEFGEIENTKLFKIKRNRALREYFSKDLPFTSFKNLLELWTEELKESRLLLMLDEFDKIQEGIENGITNAQVLENFRHLFQHNQQIGVIISGSQKLRKMRHSYWSTLYGLGKQIRVGFYSPDEEEEAIKLVEQPSINMLSFNSEATKQIIKLCALQPYFIQSLCSRIFDYCVVQNHIKNVSLKIVDEAANELIRDNEHFSSIWNQSIKENRKKYLVCSINELNKESEIISADIIISKLAQDKITYARENDLWDDLSDLSDIDVVKSNTIANKKVYALAVPLFGRWIDKRIDMAEIKRRAILEGETR